MRATAILLELYIREEGDDFGEHHGLDTLTSTFSAHTAPELSPVGDFGPDRALADGLRANGSVTSLSLAGAPIGKEGARAPRTGNR